MYVKYNLVLLFSFMAPRICKRGTHEMRYRLNSDVKLVFERFNVKHDALFSKLNQTVPL